MKSIAITGSIGSGKSQVINILAKRYPVIDCDKISHDLMQEGQIGYKAVMNDFSNLFDQNYLDRSQLAKHVFSSTEDLKRLESILHPMILEEVIRKLNSYENEKYVFVEVPLLFEANWQDYFDITLVVYTKEEILYQRLQKLRYMNKDEIDKRLKRQLPVKKKCERADYVINNDYTLNALNDRVWEFIDWLDNRL